MVGFVLKGWFCLVGFVVLCLVCIVFGLFTVWDLVVRLFSLSFFCFVLLGWGGCFGFVRVVIVVFFY